MEFCPECMAGPGNGVKSEQPPQPVFTEDGGVIMMGGKQNSTFVDSHGQPLQPMVDEHGMLVGQPLLGKDGGMIVGQPLVGKDGGMLVEGGKEGGMLVDGGLGLPIMGGEKKTGGQFVVGNTVHDKEGYLVGKDGSLVNLSIIVMSIYISKQRNILFYRS